MTFAVKRAWPLQLAAIAVVLLVWQVLAASGAAGTLLPDIPATFSAWGTLVGDGDYWAAIGATLLGAAQGLILAIIIGVPLGVLAGTIPAVQKSLHIVMDFGRAFPVIALLPVIVLMFGATTTGKTVSVLLACIFPIFVQSYDGARTVPASLHEMALSYRVPAFVRMRSIMLPGALPAIITGIRLAASMALLVAVGSEIVAGMAGMGKQITVSLTGAATAQAFVYVLTAGVLGTAIAWLLGVWEKSTLSSRESSGDNA